jgi:hypothetical protein
MSGLYTPAQVAGMYGVTTAAVRRWADAGWIDYELTGGGHRRYLAGQFAGLLGDQPGDPALVPVEVLLDAVLARFGGDVRRAVEALAEAGAEQA